MFERLRVHFGRTRDYFLTGGPLPEDAAAILAADEGTCRFYEGPLCGIHRALGPDALPAACRQFPRQVLRDGRGTFITLSHYCPTAAGLLLAGGPLTIVEAPRALALDGALEGLDALDVLPPLLRPGLLTDLDGYDEWERQALAVLDSDRWAADAALERIAAATSVLERWTPRRGPLRDAVLAAFEDAPAVQAATGEGPRGADSIGDSLRRYALAVAAVPRGLIPPRAPQSITLPRSCDAFNDARLDRAARAWIASRLFGNWIACQASGLSTVVEYLAVCLAVLHVEVARQARSAPNAPAARWLLDAIRQADLLLVHLADARTLTRLIEHDAQLRPRPIPPLRHDRHALG